MIHAADLPPDVRKKLGLPNARKPRTTQRTGPYDYTQRSSWTCAAPNCGHTSDVWARVERHAWANRHIRQELNLETGVR